MDQASTLDEMAYDPDGTEEAQPETRRRLGVGSKLYLALGGITLITLSAAVISIMAFTTLQQTLDQFTGTSIPAIKNSMALANASSNIAATAKHGRAARRIAHHPGQPDSEPPERTTAVRLRRGAAGPARQ